MPSKRPLLTHRAVADVGLGLDVLAAADHLADLEPERTREVVVALVVGRDGHQRAGPVLHQHVVGDEHRDLLAVDRVGDRAAERHAGLLALLVAALLDRLADRRVDVGADLVLVPGPGGEPLDLGMLGGDDEEGRAEERVGAGGEDGEVELELLAAEGHLGALGAPDPVALHRHDVLGPALEQLEVGEQAVGVVGDLEEPLLEACATRPAAPQRSQRPSITCSLASTVWSTGHHCTGASAR